METPEIDKHREKIQVNLKKKILALPVLIFVITLAALVIVGYLFIQYQKTQELLKNPTAATQEQVNTLTDKVGKLIVLPEGEDPTVATVSDKSKLQDQRFFAKAENGDKVLIYAKAGKAILYRPSIDKIIEMGPVNLGQTSPQSSVAPTPTNKIIEATPTVSQIQYNPQPSGTP